MADTYAIGLEAAAGGSATLLRLSGDLDINAREDLRTAILGAIDAGAADLVLDMAAVTFLDSEALGAIIEGYNRAQAGTVGFRVTGARGLVGRVLTVSGAAELFGS